MSGGDWPTGDVAEAELSRVAAGQLPSPGSRPVEVPPAAAAQSTHPRSRTAASAGWSWALAWVFVTPIAAGAFTFYALGSLWNASHDLSAAHVVDQRIDALLSTLKDAETGQRGYLLTTDRAYLKPYTNALAALPLQTALGQGSLFYLVLDRVQAPQAQDADAEPVLEALPSGPAAGAMPPVENAA